MCARSITTELKKKTNNAILSGAAERSEPDSCGVMYCELSTFLSSPLATICNAINRKWKRQRFQTRVHFLSCGILRLLTQRISSAKSRKEDDSDIQTARSISCAASFEHWSTSWMNRKAFTLHLHQWPNKLGSSQDGQKQIAKPSIPVTVALKPFA